MCVRSADTYSTMCGVCGRVIKVLDPRFKGVGFDSCSSGHALKLLASFESKSPWSAAAMGTWCTDAKLEWHLQLHFVLTSAEGKLSLMNIA